jgi:hypothetical protein
MTEDSGRARMVLAVALLILTAAIVALLIFRPPADDFVKTQLTLVLGVFLAKLGDLFSFYYGTSSGAKTLSAAQAETTKTLVEKAVTGTAGSALTAAGAPTGKPGDPVAVSAEPAAVDVDLGAPVPRVPEDPDIAALRKQFPTADDARLGVMLKVARGGF